LTDRRAEPGLKPAHFVNTRLAILLLAPQFLILLFFFFIPAVRALAQAFLLADPFGRTVHFAGLDNFRALLRSEGYRNALWVTLVFTLSQNVVTIAIAGALAIATDHVVRGSTIYKTLILAPYAIAPLIAGVLWAFLFNPLVGPLAQILQAFGVPWSPNLNGAHAMTLVVLAASWKHICYDYIFLVAGLLAVPRSLLEAAAVDGAGPLTRYMRICLPLLGPTIFFLVTMNFVYGFFETFAIIDAVTAGGPAGATSILVYKVYQDGFLNLDLGASSAQSVLLMIFAMALTMLQFRYIERKVNYSV
jgi:sn-glycerol 3-phosphate transport system permease protein